MADFREELYQGYISRFKGNNGLRSPENLAEYFSWCEYRLLPHFAKVPKDAKILELGAGAGYFLEFLRRKGYEQACGIDVADEQVKIATTRGNVVHVADAFNYLKGKAGRYDVIVALDFIGKFKQYCKSIFQQWS